MDDDCQLVEWEQWERESVHYWIDYREVTKEQYVEVQEHILAQSEPVA